MRVQDHRRGPFEKKFKKIKENALVGNRIASAATAHIAQHRGGAHSYQNLSAGALSGVINKRFKSNSFIIHINKIIIQLLSPFLHTRTINNKKLLDFLKQKSLLESCIFLTLALLGRKEQICAYFRW